VPTFRVETGNDSYPCVVERGILSQLHQHLPAKAGKLFIVTTDDVWQFLGPAVTEGLDGRAFEQLRLPGGESNKRFEHVESACEQMLELGADRSSIVIAVGGGIVNDMAGFLAAIFMRGIPVLQVPTTLLAQVDAAIGGKTGVNLRAGKNLVGAFHQPLAVLIDPEVLRTLPKREYRAGLYEVVKYGVIASPELFQLLSTSAAEILTQAPEHIERIIAESVRIKAEVVSADEREGGLRRILNFGHTIGHALEAETRYSRFLHGEAVAFGMVAATHLAARVGLLPSETAHAIFAVTKQYGPIPDLDGVTAESLVARLSKDKKTIQGKVHFVLPDRIGHVVVRSDISEADALAATRAALA
jgi:3-dehydroquinate synthase